MTDILEALIAVALPYNPGGNTPCTIGAACSGTARPVAAHGTPYSGCDTRFGGVRAMTRRYEDNVNAC